MGRIGLVLVCAASLSGCFGLEKQLRSEMRPTALVTYDIPGFAYVNPTTGLKSTPANLMSETTVPLISQKTIDADGQITKEWRTIFQNALLERSDRLCENYLDDMYIRVTARKFTLKEIAEVSTILATVVGNPWVQNLTVTSAIASQTNNLADSEILQGRLTTLIARKISADRRAIFLQIRQRQFPNGELADLDSYPISTALADANRYHSACSFRAGLQSLEKDAATGDPNAGEIVGSITTVVSN